MAAKTCALIIAVCLISIIVEGKVHKRGCPMAGPRADCIRRGRSITKRVQRDPYKKILGKNNDFLDFGTDEDFEGTEDLFFERK